MSTVSRDLRNYLRLEVKRILRESPDFGEIVFSPDRIDGVATDEPNTPSEDALYRSILDWLSSQEVLDARSLADLKAAASGRYAADFGPPTEPKIYRGLAGIPRENLARWLKIPVESLSPSGQSRVDMTVNPRNGMESWSTKKAIANQFAKRAHTSYEEIAGDVEDYLKSIPEYKSLADERLKLHRAYYDKDLRRSSTPESRARFNELSAALDDADDRLSKMRKRLVKTSSTSGYQFKYFDVVFEADVAPNSASLIDLQALLDKLDVKRSLVVYKKQAEVLAIGPVAISKIIWNPFETENRSMGIGYASFVK